MPGLSLPGRLPSVPNKGRTIAVGAGKMDVPAVVAAANDSVLEWLVVELDACATDMTEAVRQSAEYLMNSGLGQGNK